MSNDRLLWIAGQTGETPAAILAAYNANTQRLANLNADRRRMYSTRARKAADTRKTRRERVEEV